MRVADLRAQHAEKVTTSLLLKEYPTGKKKKIKGINPIRRLFSV